MLYVFSPNSKDEDKVVFFGGSLSFGRGMDVVPSYLGVLGCTAAKFALFCIFGEGRYMYK